MGGAEHQERNEHLALATSDPLLRRLCLSSDIAPHQDSNELIMIIEILLEKAAYQAWTCKVVGLNLTLTL